MCQNLVGICQSVGRGSVTRTCVGVRPILRLAVGEDAESNLDPHSQHLCERLHDLQSQGVTSSRGPSWHLVYHVQLSNPGQLGKCQLLLQLPDTLPTIGMHFR